MLPGYAPLNPLFVNSVEALPLIYDEYSMPQYQAFINVWQTHVATRCLVGGVMMMQSQTESSYFTSHDEKKAESEVKAAFIISIDSKHGSDVVVDQDFNTSTHTESIIAYGGIIAEDDQWVDWANSVQHLESPQCLDWTAIEMPDVLLPPWSPPGQAGADRVDSLRAAFKDYFDRPGCKDPKATNYNATALSDDGSCQYSKSTLRQGPTVVV